MSARITHTYLLCLALASLMLTGCYGDEPANAECDIERAWVHVENPRSIFYNVNDTLHIVGSIEKDIVFETRGDVLQTVPVYFQLTPGATICRIEHNGAEVPFRNGESIDCSSAKVVTFRVHSEDQQYHRDYHLQITARPEMPFNPIFAFDNDFEEARLQDNDAFPYYRWYYHGSQFNIDWWDSGNPGFRVTGLKVGILDYPTCPEMGTGVDGGNCIKLTTRSTGSLGAMVNMRIAAGNLFVGTFKTEKAMTKTLEATEMGRPYAHKPSRLTGYYKYLPGSVRQDRQGNPVVGKTDCPDFYCVVYRNADDKDNPIQLDGSNILSSPYIVGVGRIQSQDIDCSGTAWKPFDLPIVYSQEIEQADVFNYHYNTAIVFSSSVDGAAFEGAVGSTLWIDNVTLVCEY